MNLSPVERVILINQFKILAKLYPEEEESFLNKCEVLQSGYTLNYSWILPNVSEEMSPETCREVLDILNMYDSIRISILEGATLPKEYSEIQNFRGFDANDESELYGYARYLMIDEGRYQELVKQCRLPGEDDSYPDVNSHFPMLSKYKKMLYEWKKLGSPRIMDSITLKSFLDNVR